MKQHKHSIYTLCHECNTWGVNGVGNKKCGDCGSFDTTTYYPEECLDYAPKFTYVFEEVKDEKFHALRKAYVNAQKELADYLGVE